MHKIIQMANQLQRSEEDNARTLRNLAGQTRDTNLASQLRTLESKERSSANQLRQLAAQLSQTGGTGMGGTTGAYRGTGSSRGVNDIESAGFEKTNWEE